MKNIYRVAIHYNEDIGYVEYSEDTKQAKVILKTADKQAEVEKFLETEHEIQVPHETLMDFAVETVQPLSSLASLQLGLTRLWGKTGVFVDWSRPIPEI